VAEPHARPLHAIPLSTQQVLFWQTPAAQTPHITVWPQLFVLVVLQDEPHVVARLSGVQQVPFSQISVPTAQFAVPAAPQNTVWPQLFLTDPQTFPAHAVATDSGTQPQDPPVQLWPPSHPPHAIDCPQLFVEPLQRFAHQFGSGVQQLLVDRHTPASPQLLAVHMNVWPQLSVICSLHFPMHGVTSSGVQHVPLERQMSFDVGHAALPPLPQGTVCPQLFVAEPHVRPAHVVLCGSGAQPHAFCVQVAPPSQPPHVMGWLQLSTV